MLEGGCRTYPGYPRSTTFPWVGGSWSGGYSWNSRCNPKTGLYVLSESIQNSFVGASKAPVGLDLVYLLGVAIQATGLCVLPDFSRIVMEATDGWEPQEGGGKEPGPMVIQFIATSACKYWCAIIYPSNDPLGSTRQSNMNDCNITKYPNQQFYIRIYTPPSLPSRPRTGAGHSFFFEIPDILNHFFKSFIFNRFCFRKNNYF